MQELSSFRLADPISDGVMMIVISVMRDVKKMFGIIVSLLHWYQIEILNCVCLNELGIRQGSIFKNSRLQKMKTYEVDYLIFSCISIKFLKVPESVRKVFTTTKK